VLKSSISNIALPKSASAKPADSTADVDIKKGAAQTITASIIVYLPEALTGNVSRPTNKDKTLGHLGISVKGTYLVQTTIQFGEAR